MFYPTGRFGNLSSIENAGEEGLSLEQVAQSVGIDGTDIEQEDTISEMLQSFNHVIKVNAFVHIRVIAYSKSAKHFLHIFSSSYGDNSRPIDVNSHQVAGEQHRNKGIQNICL